jgi:hypothetical protein
MIFLFGVIRQKFLVIQIHIFYIQFKAKTTKDPEVLGDESTDLGVVRDLVRFSE